MYALPEMPPLYLPDDWDERVRAAGSIVFRAGPDRDVTLANLPGVFRLTPALAREIFAHHRGKVVKHLERYAVSPSPKLARHIAQHMAFAELARTRVEVLADAHQ